VKTNDAIRQDRESPLRILSGTPEGDTLMEDSIRSKVFTGAEYHINIANNGMATFGEIIAE
jgi:hypothetical protein